MSRSPHPAAQRRAPRPSRSPWMALGVAAAGFMMLCASFAAVPLYKVFCQATGYGGTPVIGGVAPGSAAQAVKIEVRFNADVNGGLPWRFAPDQNAVQITPGDQQVAFFHAQNEAKFPVSGIAIYNITPDKVAHYFHKTACFCFNQQTLAPGQKMEFPVSFYVDPAIATDPATREVHTITLSYSFYRTLDDAQRSGALAKAGPHVGANPALLSLASTDNANKGQP